jgi:dGTP triphosphohydrolase
MDWADLLAYAVYDFEDFVRSGDIPMTQLRVSSGERQWLLDLVFARRRVPAVQQELYARVLDRLLVDCPPSTGDTRRFRNALRCFANHLVIEAIGGVELRAGDDGAVTLVTAPEQHAMIMLTEGLTWHYVIDSAMLAPLRSEQRQLVRELFLSLVDASGQPSRMGMLPPALRRRLDQAQNQSDVLRLVADAVASMPERDAIAFHAMFAGS